MSETFACPHCKNEFPALPCLVGRKVRCSSCSKVFMLQANGIAIAVQPGQVTAAHKAQPPQSPQPPQEAASMPAPPAPVVEPAAAADASDAPAVRRGTPASGLFETPEPSRHATATDDELRQLTRTWVEGDTMATKRRSAKRQTGAPMSKPQRITSRAEALRKSLRSNLQAAAAQAAASVHGHDIEDIELDLDDEEASRRLKPRSEVRLSGEGQQKAKARMMSLGVLAGVFIASLVLVFAMGGSDPMVEVLERYADGGGGKVSVSERRARAWFSTVDGAVSPLLLADPGRVTVHTPQRHTLEALQMLVGERLEGYVPYDELGCFVDEEDLGDLRVLYSDVGTGLLTLDTARAEHKNIDFVTYEEVVEALREAGVGGELLHMLSQGLAGEAERSPSLRDRWLAGDLPVACDVVVLRGQKAAELRVEGRAVRAVGLDDYTAILVRFLGSDWDTEWRVYDCYRSEDPQHLENALKVRTRIARFTNG